MMKLRHLTVFLSAMLLSFLSVQAFATAAEDKALMDNVKTKLTTDPNTTNLMKSKKIKLKVKDGMVTVTGKVASDEEKQNIATAAQSVDGVKSVDTDKVKVKAEKGSMQTKDKASQGTPAEEGRSSSSY